MLFRGGLVAAQLLFTLLMLSVIPAAQAQAPASSAALGVWRLIGPEPVEQGTSLFSGQVSAIAIDPKDVNTVYIGTAAGGVWKTSNGGTLGREQISSPVAGY